MGLKLLNDCVSEQNEKLYLKEDFADVHFSFKENGIVQQVPANKAILAVQSPVFEKMFFGSKKKTIIHISNASVGDFEDLLQFFYLREVDIAVQNFKRVRQLAKKYGILDRFDHSFQLYEDSVERKLNPLPIELQVKVYCVLSFVFLLAYLKDNGQPLLSVILLIIHLTFALSFIKVGNQGLISLIIETLLYTENSQ